MKLTKIRLRNFRGLEAIELDVPAKGIIAKGGNARGKSSLLKAVRSVLESKDIDADAIRQGSDRAEILVDMDAVSVKRVITAKTSTLTVEKDGMKASKPTQYLRELLGTSALDPLELYLAKAKDRRALILSALPCTITREQLAKYTGGEVPPDVTTEGHGLEVLKKAHDFFYAERTIANKEAADAKREAERLAEEARKAAGAVTPGPIVPESDAIPALEAASRALVEIEARARDANAAASRTASQREEVTRLRATADEQALRFAGEPIDLAPLDAERVAASAAVEECRQRLADAESRLTRAATARQEAINSNAILEAGRAAVATKRAQATAIEEALAAGAVPAPSEGALTVARKAVEIAKANVDRAALQSRAMMMIAASDKGAAEAKRLAEEAAELDATVKRLANEAPAELLSSADGIPGLTVDGDEVKLDGKSLDALSGAEQLKFAVEVARRANGKTKILVCDGLERLDTEQLDAFVRHATRDGWQLIGSLVTGGALEVVAIEPDAEAVAAE